ncbi:transposase [Streptomyces zaomyceticus]|uniref:transposase n=1 Tax=Streptomyces zaomyceticus TaxID=68286 RepID=UPI0036CE80A6
MSADNFTAHACACLPCRYGNVPSGPLHERAFETDMTDTEWEDVRAVIPSPPWMEGRGGRPEEYGHRQMLDALRYLADNGVKWRSLPEPFPPPRGTLRAADGRDH